MGTHKDELAPAKKRVRKEKYKVIFRTGDTYWHVSNKDDLTSLKKAREHAKNYTRYDTMIVEIKDHIKGTHPNEL